MSGSRDEVIKVAAAVGYTIPESEIDDYVGFFGRARAAFEAVEAMEGSPSPHY